MTSGASGARSTSISTTGAPRRRFARAGALGAAAAFVLFAWMLTAGSFRLTPSQPLGNFYDAQAHALLGGHWNVDPHALGVEGFVISGRTYTYFGPVPALLRMPVAALTDRFDGRLTTLSMLVAFVVTAVFVVRMAWVVRRLVRAGTPAVSRRELWIVGLFVFALMGSTPLYLASRAWVYHEALLWGLALALASYDTLLRFALTRSRRNLVLASALATAAFLTRASIGAGPVAALVLLAVIGGVSRARARPGPSRWRRATSVTPLWLLVAAAVTPVVLYAAVNEVKFQSAFGLPMDKQVISRFDQNRKETLAANGGNIFGPQFVPTAVVQYLRPDALGWDRLFPWVAFPPWRATVLGGARFDYRDRSSSLPATVPVLVVLGGMGVAAMGRRRRGDRGDQPDAGLVWVLLLGALAGSATFLTIGFIANRYLTDALPVLVLPAVVGLHRGVARTESPAEPRAPRRRAETAAGLALGALALFGVYANFALALWYQRDYGQNGSEDDRAAFVGFQQRLDRGLPGEPSADVRDGRSDELLPKAGSDGQLYAVLDVGDRRRCAGLYLSDGKGWLPVERTSATGRFRLDVQIDRRPAGERDPLVTAGAGAQRLVLALEWRQGQRVALARRLGTGRWITGQPFSLGSGHHAINVVVDRRLAQVDVDVDASSVFSDLVPVPDARLALVGRAPADASARSLRPTFPGRLSVRPFNAPVCGALLAHTKVRPDAAP